MKMRTASFLTMLTVVLVTAGCGSTPTSPASSSRVDDQPRFVPKQIPSLTAAERLLLSTNGYAVGVWAEKCGDPNAT